MLLLTVLQGADRGRRFELPENEPQLLGRSSEALPLTDPTMSRRHAELTPDSGRWFINDLKSANGTWVNGLRVTRRQLLSPGDQIRTGNSLLLFGKESSSGKLQEVRMVPHAQSGAAVEHTIASNDDSVIMAIIDPSDAASVQLKILFELTQLVGSCEGIEDLLTKVMDLIFDFFQADRGFILLQDSVDERREPVVIRHRVKPADNNEGKIMVSRTIVQHVLRNSEGVLSSNAMSDNRFASGQSVQNYKIRSAMCVPIKYKNRIFGVIHLDSQVANYTYTEEQLKLLTAIGVQTGMAVMSEGAYADRVHRERLAAVGQTVASLSHSIKNILQGMRGGADVVELGLKKDNMKVVRGGWDIVARNLERIYGLTMNMLMYSKQRRPELELSSLPNLLNEIVELIQSRFDAKNIALITDFDEQMPPVPIDSSGIHQAILNLLLNALDATESGKGVVTLRCHYDEGPQVLHIEVIDNGHGMEEETRSKLFQPFYSTKGLGGTGLGLVVTKKIIDEHNGSIEVTSTHDEGTTFKISLPCGTDVFRESAETIAPGELNRSDF